MQTQAHVVLFRMTELLDPSGRTGRELVGVRVTCGDSAYFGVLYDEEAAVVLALPESDILERVRSVAPGVLEAAENVRLLGEVHPLACLTREGGAIPRRH